MSHLTVFTDGSVNVQKQIGIGGYLAISDKDLAEETMESKVHLKLFEETSSTKLEIQTVLWALNQLKDRTSRITIFTDSQNIVRLPERRQRLETNDFKSKQGKLLNNHELYREFYSITDSLQCEIIKIKGHKPAKHYQYLDRLFSLVDRATRKKLREQPN